MSLFWRSFLANVAVILAAAVVLMLSPVTVSHPVSLVEIQVMVVGVLAAFAVNAWLVRRVVRPLQQLRESVETVDSPHAAGHLPVGGPDEIAAITEAFNRMLDRLRVERAEVSRAALRAQEEERARVSSELHDQVGQSLTAVLLGLQVASRRAAEDQRPQLDQVSETVRGALEEVRSISASLRPGVLDDLGLAAALRGLVAELDPVSEVQIVAELSDDVSAGPDQELVVYRIAQEALTNVVRHAGAAHATLRLLPAADQLRLTVVDDGSGLSGPPGTGLTGMRERARLVGAELDVRSLPGRGTTVSLVMARGIPSETGGAARHGEAGEGEGT